MFAKISPARGKVMLGRAEGLNRLERRWRASGVLSRRCADRTLRAHYFDQPEKAVGRRGDAARSSDRRRHCARRTRAPRRLVRFSADLRPARRLFGLGIPLRSLHRRAQLGFGHHRRDALQSCTLFTSSGCFPRAWRLRDARRRSQSHCASPTSSRALRSPSRPGWRSRS